jgi:serine phosphatase RsbU (regulator of sigma subunit)
VFASIYLAKDFASRNQIILEQEREAKKMEINQKLLEAEDKRKAKELNDARELQLSLLPDCETNLGNYEFCFDMQTASEVGGDYYDYKVSENGDIYLVIGDATDHGMKAGMMVSIIKSLFLSQIDKSEIVNFLNTCSRTIKQMKLKNLYMALMVIKLENNTLTFSSAGIPPLFIHRKKTNLLEEFKLKGMPLGAIEFFPYETSQVELEEGDTVLAMTDGLPDLFNMHKQSFDLDNIKKIFLESANESVNNIVGNLISAGKKWLNGSKQNDDITIVAFRLKQ